MEKEEPIPGPKEYVKIKGVWQHTNMSWFIDKEKMNAPIPTSITPPGSLGLVNIHLAVEHYQCVAHVHHWKTELEEYCRVDQDWKCIRCEDITPESIQSMVKLYRPLKDVQL